MDYVRNFKPFSKEKGCLDLKPAADKYNKFTRQTEVLTFQSGGLVGKGNTFYLQLFYFSIQQEFVNQENRRNRKIYQVSPLRNQVFLNYDIF